MPEEIQKSAPVAASSIRTQLADARIIMGDQSPWAGGLLRWRAVKEALENEIIYAVQDVDAPWVQKGRCGVHVAHGWAPYYSLACRYPWTLSAPDAAIPKVMDSLRSPRGLHYLIGPSTDETLASLRASGQTGSYAACLSEMLGDETAWAHKLADWLGLPATTPTNGAPEADLESWTADLSESLHLDSTRRFSELFQNGELAVTGAFPANRYWYLDRDLKRRQESGAGRVPFPRGMILPLELAANGLVLACTALPYLDPMLALRDRYLPGIKLKLLRVTFDWSLNDADPIDRVLEAFARRKRRRGQKVPPFDPSDLEAIRSYWRARPTVISWLILGGRLNPQLELLER